MIDDLEDKMRTSSPRKPRESYATVVLHISLLVVTINSLVVVLFGSGVNYHGNKYASSRSSPSCSRELFIRNIPDSYLCCDGRQAYSWVCIASSRSDITAILSSKWAFVLPLLPWAVNILFEYITYGSIINMISALKRLMIGVTLILFRTVSVCPRVDPDRWVTLLS